MDFGFATGAFEEVEVEAEAEVSACREDSVADLDCFAAGVDLLAFLAMMESCSEWYLLIDL